MIMTIILRYNSPISATSKRSNCYLNMSQTGRIRVFLMCIGCFWAQQKATKGNKTQHYWKICFCRYTYFQELRCKHSWQVVSHPLARFNVQGSRNWTARQPAPLWSLTIQN